MATRPSIVRSYNLHVLNQLPKKTTSISYETIGKSELGNPIVCIKVEHDKNNPYILITGGVHGDEPIGPLFCVHCFDVFEKYTRFNYIIIPSINPDGFERDTRENKRGVDLNRDAKEGTEEDDDTGELVELSPASKEMKAVMEYIRSLGITFEMSIDIHESGGSEGVESDDDPAPSAFYMWEINPDIETRLGQNVINALYDNHIPTCNWETIFGDTNNNGVIFYPEGCLSAEYSKAKTLDSFCKQFAKRSFTTETSIHDTIEYRFKVLEIVLTTLFKFAQ